MTIHEAIKRGIKYIRKPQWANKNDYLELPLAIPGQCGLVATLHSPAFIEISKIPGNEDMAELIKQDILVIQLNPIGDDEYEPYRGVLTAKKQIEQVKSQTTKE